jgi:beta-glucosidase
MSIAELARGFPHGTSKRFGIVRVDYETQRRTVKASGRWYAPLIAAARAGAAAG